MGLLSLTKNHPQRLLPTIAMLPCFFATGLSVAIVGPTDMLVVG